MTSTRVKSFNGATAALAALTTALIGAQTANADPALLMGSTICQNQRDAMDYPWVTSNVDNLKLFFISGDDDEDGAITAIGHENAFNASDDVYISIHGAVDEVGDFSGSDFAAVFLANHADTPNSVTFYVCQSGTVPEGGVSSMAKLARSYPGEAENSTLITAVNAPQAGCSPALAVNAEETPFDPIQTIQPATYRTNISTTGDHDQILTALTEAWISNETPYPETETSYAAYCATKLEEDPTGASWVRAFIDNVVDEFGEEYLSLVNTNYAGEGLSTCGADVQCD